MSISVCDKVSNHDDTTTQKILHLAHLGGELPRRPPPRPVTQRMDPSPISPRHMGHVAALAHRTAEVYTRFAEPVAARCPARRLRGEGLHTHQV